MHACMKCKGVDTFCSNKLVAPLYFVTLQILVTMVALNLVRRPRRRDTRLLRCTRSVVNSAPARSGAPQIVAAILHTFFEAHSKPLPGPRRPRCHPLVGLLCHVCLGLWPQKHLRTQAALKKLVCAVATLHRTAIGKKTL